MPQAKVKQFTVTLFAFAIAWHSDMISAGRNYLEFLQSEESKTTIQSLKSNNEGPSSFFPSSSSQGALEVGPFPKVMSSMEELYVFPQRESYEIMKGWGHAHLENDSTGQKLTGWFKQNEQETTACCHTQSTELMSWCRKIKQVWLDLPWGHLSDLQTEDLPGYRINVIKDQYNQDQCNTGHD